MKKTQVALAALALVASTAALAEVKVSGQFDVGVGTTTGVGGGFMEQGGWADNSHIRFSGSEDLGNGLKAGFTLESGFTQNGNPGNGGNGTLFSRESTVNLSGDFGSVRLGQQVSPYIVSHAISHAGSPGAFWVNRIIMGGGLGAAAVGTGNGGYQAGGFFIANAVSYTTPNINGWTASLLTNTENGARDGTMPASSSDADKYSSFNVIGAFGPINVTAGYQNRKDTYTSSVIGASTTFGDLTIAANISNHSPNATSSNTNKGTKTSAQMLSATYKLQEALSLNVAYATNDLATSQSLTSFGLKYDFSKATYAYVTYISGTNGAQSALSQRANYAATGDTTTRNTSVVGISHSF